MLYYNKTTDRVLRELNTTQNGLGTTAIKKAEAKYGKNEIVFETTPLWRKLAEPFTDIFVVILLIAVVLSVIMHEYIDAVVISVIIAINIGIDYAQKFSTAKILNSLRDQATQEVTVKRNLEFIKIKETDLVPGDIVMLAEGNRIPADIRIIDSASLFVNESALTGESLPIAKNEKAIRGIKDVYDQTNMLFQGTFVTSGTCTGVVCNTGGNTEFSKIAKLVNIEAEKNPIQKKIAKLVSQIILMVFAVAIITFALLLLRGENILEALRFVLALSVSAVPEGLPITVSIILALGMRTMARHNALVTNMRSLEVIGSVNVIATDKTGTLSKNQLVIQELWQAPLTHPIFNIEEAVSLSQTITTGGNPDPLDAVIEKYAENKAKPPLELVQAMPFVQELTLSGNVYKDNTFYYCALKGSPEKMILISDLTEEEREQANHTLNHFTNQGFRVIALGMLKTKKSFAKLEAIAKQKNIQLVGFLAIADELRPESKPSVKMVKDAGISVHMITGDHANTAYTIGKNLGIASNPDQVLDSSKIDQLASHEDIKKFKVFSRIMPEDKFRILSLLKRGDIVAMTGDGVNDAPALSNAHVGIAMGDGSQIAKDASDIIILDNNFETVATAIKQGRIIIDNIKRIIVYLLSTNAGEVITMVTALLAGWPAPLLPIQILWVNIVTDTTMVIPLGLEPGEKNIMTRKPSSPNAPILSRFMIIRMLMTSLTIAFTTLFVYGFFLNKADQGYAQSAAFLALVVTQWANAFAMRSHTESAFSRLKVKNKVFWGMLAASILIQFAVLETPLGQLLHITPLHYSDFALIALIAFVVPIAVSEIQKYIQKRHQIEI